MKLCIFTSFLYCMALVVADPAVVCTSQPSITLTAGGTIVSL